MKESIQVAIPDIRPSLPELTVTYALWKKEDVLNLFLPGKRTMEKEGDLEIYTQPDGKEVDIYPQPGFIYVFPSLPIKTSVSLDEAEKIARKFLEDFGGLPQDAELFEKGTIPAQDLGTIHYFTFGHKYHEIPVETDIIRVSVIGKQVSELVFFWSRIEKEGKPTEILHAMDGIRKAWEYFHRKIFNRPLVPAKVVKLDLMYFYASSREFTKLVPMWRIGLRAEITEITEGRMQKRPFEIVLRVNALTGEVWEAWK
ncbi:MAG: hypothetical protein V2G48_06630 [bacterium JZ-2024 1]